MEKKDIVMMVLLIVIIISGISIIYLTFIATQPLPSESTSTLIVGTYSGPHTLDPVDSWDMHSSQVINQVCETLFARDLNNSHLPRINKLTEDYFWKNLTTLHLKVQEGVKFHDDYLFNASTVKWNIDRLLYLTNCSGNNMGEVAITQYLWMLPDGVTPIINRIEVINEFNISIYLNAPFAPLLDLLCHETSSMLSPQSTPATSFISLNKGKLVGTGPFKFDSFTSEEVILSRWEGYWRNLAYFDKIKFVIIPDSEERINAMLNNQIDYLIDFNKSFISAFEADDDVYVKHFTDDTDISSFAYSYLSLNNHKFNLTWRQSISYAINYTYIIQDLRQDTVIRANSPISPGFGPSYNKSSKAADYNITKAREIMVSMGFGDMQWSDSQWIDVAYTSPFCSIEYYEHILIHTDYDLVDALTRDLCLIGVNLYTYFENLDVIVVEWMPDYLDPFSILNPLFNPISQSNIALVNDSWLNTQMGLALNTTDCVARSNIYKNIQRYLAEVGFFHAYFYHTKIYFIHSANLCGIPYNAWRKFDAYSIKRV